MQTQKQKNILLASGLLILSASFFVQMMKMPEFLNGFMKGLGFTLIVAALIMKMKKKKAKQASSQA